MKQNARTCDNINKEWCQNWTFQFLKIKDSVIEPKDEKEKLKKRVKRYNKIFEKFKS